MGDAITARGGAGQISAAPSRPKAADWMALSIVSAGVRGRRRGRAGVGWLIRLAQHRTDACVYATGFARVVLISVETR